MSYRTVMGGLALAALVSGVAGCGDNKNFTTTSTTENGQKIRVIGRVMNAQTFAGVGNATIEVCGITSGKADSNGNFVIDIPGNFTEPFRGFIGNDGSATTNFIVKISSRGMATIFTEANFFNDETPQTFGDSSAIEQDPGLRSTTVIDLGTMGMNTGFTQQIVVSRDGAPLANARVAVFSGSNAQNVQNGFSTLIDAVMPSDISCYDDQTATTNSNGIATFSNLDPFRPYTVVVPSQDLDGQPGFDFLTEVEGFTVQGSGAVYALDVDGTNFFSSGDVRITDDNAKDFVSVDFDYGAIASVTSSGTILTQSFVNNSFGGAQVTTTAFNFAEDDVNDRGVGGVDGGDGFDEFVTNSNGAVTFVFTNPVHVVQGDLGHEVSFQYFDNMIDPTSAGFNKFHLVTGTATQLSTALGTIWTIAPSQTIPVYTPYTVEFAANNVAQPAVVRDLGRRYMRVPTGLSSTIGVKADNYNGTIANAVSVTGNVFFDFDRIVRGTYKIIDVTRNNVTSVVNSIQPIDDDSFTDNVRSIVFNADAATGATRANDLSNLGATEGFRYRVRATSNGFGGWFNMSDDRADDRNVIRVAFVVEDIEGNTLNTILDLPVQ